MTVYIIAKHARYDGVDPYEDLKFANTREEAEKIAGYLKAFGNNYEYWNVIEAKHWTDTEEEVE